MQLTSKSFSIHLPSMTFYSLDCFNLLEIIRIMNARLIMVCTNKTRGLMTDRPRWEIFKEKNGQNQLFLDMMSKKIDKITQISKFPQVLWPPRC